MAYYTLLIHITILSVLWEQTGYTETKDCSPVHDLLRNLPFIQRVNAQQFAAILTRNYVKAVTNLTRSTLFFLYGEWYVYVVLIKEEKVDYT
jgi:hypothetical protein